MGVIVDAAVFTDAVDVECADAVPVERSTPNTNTKLATILRNIILNGVYRRRIYFSHFLKEESPFYCAETLRET